MVGRALEGRADQARPIALGLPRGDPGWDEADALLQAGFLLPARPGVSAREFMREALGFEDRYIEAVVSTVFIDAQPVDDIDAARLRPGSLIALSAAMPGLVGAVMRRRSPYASFREAISYPSAREAEGLAPGRAQATEGERMLVRVKLFNSVMRDRGRDILAGGILVEAQAAAGILGRSPATWGAATKAEAGTLLRLRVFERGQESRP